MHAHMHMHDQIVLAYTKQQNSETDVKSLAHPLVLRLYYGAVFNSEDHITFYPLNVCCFIHGEDMQCGSQCFLLMNVQGCYVLQNV